MDIRAKFLDFFARKGHAIVQSASLLPENDPTTLFTGSGMQPMVPYLLGQKHPSGSRIADSQKCFRSGDIDEVGDNRHTTFFEMLGNWSLGDFFKEQQIPWMWEFLTQEICLPKERLYFTCFRGNEALGIPRDTESAELWQKLIGEDAKIVDFSERDGMQGGRIFYYDEKKNWWSRSGVPANMPIGEPGGPDTEMFYDFDPNEIKGIHKKWVEQVPAVFEATKERRVTQPCHVNCDCGRFMEIGNNVFMEYKKIANGFELLKQQNVDFGGGLERLYSALNDSQDIFKTELFVHIRASLDELSSKNYIALTESETIRFSLGSGNQMIKDKLFVGLDNNSNEVGFKREQIIFSYRVIMDHIRAAVFLISDGAAPSNKDQGYFTRRLLRRAIRHARNLNIASSFCEPVACAVIETYKDTYPMLLTNKSAILYEIKSEEQKFIVSLQKGLQRLSKIIEEFNQKEQSMVHIRDDFGSRSGDYINAISGKDAFDLYQNYGFPFEIITEELAKYALFPHEGEFLKFKKEFEEEREKHKNLSRAGSEQKFKGGLGDTSDVSVRYHTATHLLHAALKKILGAHVEQKGSNITPERMRFDFSHPEKMTPEQISATEALVNAAIERDYGVSWHEMSVEEARAKQAIGLFGDKYGEQVKVYTVGDPNALAAADPTAPTFSREICGGPHVEHTGQIGHFKIIKEEAVSAGVRRIKAVVE